MTKYFPANMSIPADYQVSGLGFFCRAELRVEKTISFPVRIRLGSTEYVNYLESKPNSRKSF